MGIARLLDEQQPDNMQKPISALAETRLRKAYVAGRVLQ
jgi:hypothetical protein